MSLYHKKFSTILNLQTLMLKMDSRQHYVLQFNFAYQTNCCMEHKKFCFPIMHFQVRIKAFLQFFAHLAKPIHDL